MLAATIVYIPAIWQTDLDPFMSHISDYYKAGGPHYLQRFVIEKTITNNTAALGGNASLLALGDE